MSVDIDTLALQCDTCRADYSTCYTAYAVATLLRQAAENVAMLAKCGRTLRLVDATSGEEVATPTAQELTRLGVELTDAQKAYADAQREVLLHPDDRTMVNAKQPIWIDEKCTQRADGTNCEHQVVYVDDADHKHVHPRMTRVEILQLYAKHPTLSIPAHFTRNERKRPRPSSSDEDDDDEVSIVSVTQNVNLHA